MGSRHRKDMGDLTTLAESIRQEGLLQPIGVTDRLELVFGERRLRAVRDILKKKTILARIVDVTSILAGEYHENEISKDFTPSERVAIAKAIEQQIGNRRGQRRTGNVGQKLQTLTPARRPVTPPQRAGFGNDETYRQAAKVVESGTPRLIQAMDEGRVSISAASILAAPTPTSRRPSSNLTRKPSCKRPRRSSRQAEQRAEHQDAKTPKPQARPRENA